MNDIRVPLIQTGPYIYRPITSIRRISAEEKVGLLGAKINPKKSVIQWAPDDNFEISSMKSFTFDMPVDELVKKIGNVVNIAA